MGGQGKTLCLSFLFDASTNLPIFLSYALPLLLAIAHIVEKSESKFWAGMIVFPELFSLLLLQPGIARMWVVVIWSCAA